MLTRAARPEGTQLSNRTLLTSWRGDVTHWSTTWVGYRSWRCVRQPMSMDQKVTAISRSAF